MQWIKATIKILKLEKSEFAIQVEIHESIDIISRDSFQF